MKRSISLTMVLIMMLSCISGLAFIKPMKVDAAEHKNLAPILMGDSWKFDMTVTNSTNDTLTPMELTILKLSDGRIVDECKFEQAWLKDQGISAIRSGESFSFTDGHPVVYYFNEMKYEFLLKDSNGKTVIETFDFQCDLAEEMTQKVSNCVDAKQEGEQWIFSMNIKNTTTDNLKTTNLVIYQLKDTKVVEYYTFDKEWLKEQKLSVIEAGKSAKFIDGHPFDYRFNVMKYVFTMEDKQGERVTKSFCFRCNVTQPDFSKSKVKNITTLRHSAKFNVKVADGVYWVPAVSLGKSSYTNAEISKLCKTSPSNKAKKIDTLYEALQLYQVSGFYAVEDNQRVFWNGINWEMHKPGFDAVRTNSGCCTTSSNWLNYILKGDYDEVGFLAYSNRDSGGHVFNYIKQDGWYYFVDLTKYRYRSYNSAVENGKLEDYYQTDYIAGNIHKAKSVKSYVNYIQSNYDEPPVLMVKYKATDAVDMDGYSDGNGGYIIYGSKSITTINVIYNDGTLKPIFVNRPNIIYDWSLFKSYQFK